VSELTQTNSSQRACLAWRAFPPGSNASDPQAPTAPARRWLRGESARGDRYVIVMDAGSSGTRLHVYRWAAARRGEHLPRAVELRGGGAGDAAAARAAKAHAVAGLVGSAQGSAFRRTETEPGLDSFAHSARTLQAGVNGALQPLLHWAMAEVRACFAYTALQPEAGSGPLRQQRDERPKP